MEVVNVILIFVKNDFLVCIEELLSFIKERILDKKVCFFEYVFFR